MDNNFYAIIVLDNGREIHVTPSDKVKKQYEQEGQVWFTESEIEKLKGLDQDALDHVLEVKRCFGGDVVK